MIKRRTFLKLSALGLLPIIGCRPETQGITYDITLESDRKTGHLVFKSLLYPSAQTFHTETLIVGGGIAGLSAATQLKGRDFILCEAGQRLGGSASGREHEGTVFCQGAHYDLAYPDYYGKETLQSLEQLGIIEHNGLKNQWEFTAKQYIIPHEIESGCWNNGYYQEEVLPNLSATQDLLNLLAQYQGKMPLPTRLIEEKYRHLDQLTFKDFLSSHISLPSELLRALDYHMIDDYGATASEVSALAGIHYYQCRPYYAENPPELFSPPEGNYYFIKKMAAKLPAENLKTAHLVKSIEKTTKGFKAKVVDANKKQVHTVHCRQIVYAGHKHAVQYVFPQDKELFASNTYAPWLVLNFILNADWFEQGLWQNEMITDNPRFLGFVDSSAQYQGTNKHRVLTAYYCFSPEERKYLAELEGNEQEIVRKTVTYMSKFMDYDLNPFIEKVYMKVMGHAMPVPRPGYLFDDKNNRRSEKKLTYAGVDNGRLPLFFEAFDSGINAVNLLNTIN